MFDADAVLSYLADRAHDPKIALVVNGTLATGARDDWGISVAVVPAGGELGVQWHLPHPEAQNLQWDFAVDDSLRWRNSDPLRDKDLRRVQNPDGLVLRVLHCEVVEAHVEVVDEVDGAADGTVVLDNVACWVGHRRQRCPIARPSGSHLQTSVSKQASRQAGRQQHTV